VKSVTVIVSDPGPTTTVATRSVTGVAADPQPSAGAANPPAAASGDAAAAPATTAPAVEVLGSIITRDGLARTGFNARLLIVAGLLLIGLGAAVAVSTRRRPAHSASAQHRP
jgi:hypothetical protein